MTKEIEKALKDAKLKLEKYDEEEFLIKKELYSKELIEKERKVKEHQELIKAKIEKMLSSIPSQIEAAVKNKEKSIILFSNISRAYIDNKYEINEGLALDDNRIMKAVFDHLKKIGARVKIEIDQEAHMVSIDNWVESTYKMVLYLW